MKIRFILVFVFEVVLLSACTTSDSLTVSPQTYIPLRVGDYRTYLVKRISHNQLSCQSPAHDTTKIFFIKTIVSDSTKNSEGGYTYIIQRFTTTDTTKGYLNLDTWSARVSANQVVVSEENIPYLKFTFPLKDNSTWNGNLYNSLSAENYKLINYNTSYTLSNGKKFSNTLRVNQSNTQNLLNNNVRFEIYASGVGLIYSYSSVNKYLQNKTQQDNCFGLKVPESGIDYEQTLLRYGHQ